MADGYTPVYDNQDLTEAGTDAFASVWVFAAGFAGVIVLAGAVVMGIRYWKKN